MSKKLEEAMQGIGTPKTDRVFCRRCGQELKDSVSKAAGIGPICSGKEAMEMGEVEYNEELANADCST